MKNLLKPIGLALFCGLTVAAQATISIETSYTSKNGTPVTLPDNSSFFKIEAPGANDHSCLVTLADGQIFRGEAAFDTRATEALSPVFNDQAAVTVWSPGMTTPLTLWSMNAVTAWSLNHGTTGACDFVNWTPWYYQNTSGSTETFTFDYSVSFLDPHGKFDSIGLFAPVPEPSTWVAGAVLGLMTVLSCVQKARRKSACLS